MNEIYRKYIKCSPTRAVIGCQDLNKTYQIEIVTLYAYKVKEIDFCCISVSLHIFSFETVQFDTSTPLNVTTLRIHMATSS